MPESSTVLPTEFSLLEGFMTISDPRSEKGRKHPLVNILVIAVCAVICGADNWVEIEDWANAKREWLETFLDLTNGVPSHDTFGRVFAILSPDEFQETFIKWARNLVVDVEGKVVAIDGKTVRRSHDGANNRSAIHVVNAWCTSAGVSLGQLKTEEKSNEITAVPKLLRLLHLKGAIVTLDAMGCQKKIASTILDREADYLLAVKGNQPTLEVELKEWFDCGQGKGFQEMDVEFATERSKGHGREEERNLWIAPVPEDLKSCKQWPEMRSIIWAESLRTIKGKTSSHSRYYISSLPPTNAPRVLTAVREHWGVENGLHWTLDVAFREDESRIRQGFAAENMGRLRQFALNMIKQEKTLKIGVKGRRLRSGWDNNYLLKVLKAGS